MNTCTPIAAICAATAVMFSLNAAVPVLADDVPRPDIALSVNDVTPSTGFAPDAVTEVVGLRIGMTSAEVEAALKSTDLPLFENAEEIVGAGQFDPRRLGFKFRGADLKPQFTWKDGFQISFEPILGSAGLTLYAQQADAAGNFADYTAGQHLWVSFGGPSVGARVQEIRRSQKLEEPVDAQAMLAGIADKYGAPSWIKPTGNFWIDVAYYYKGGQQIAESDRNRSRFSNACKPPSTTGGVADILYSEVNIAYWYGNWSDPREARDECDANIFVRLHFGDLPNTINALDVTVIDNVARWENSNAISIQAEAAHTEWLKSVAGSAKTPKL